MAASLSVCSTISRIKLFFALSCSNFLTVDEAVFKANIGSVPEPGKRMGVWVLENATIMDK